MAPITVGSRAFHRVSLGVESTHGTRVDPTFNLNMASSSIITLDKSPANPDEDYQSLVMNQPGRGTFGVRLAGLQMDGVARYQDLMRYCQHWWAGGVTPTGATSKTISGNTAASPTVVTTTAAHGLVTGDTVLISGSNSTPLIDGTWTVTVLTTTTFSIPVNVTIAGTAGSVAAGADKWVFPLDASSDTLKSATIQEGDNVQAYEMTYGMITDGHLSFNQLTAPGNMPWELKTTWMGQDKVPTAFTGTPATVTGAESLMGHLTRAYIDTTSVAFGSGTEEVGVLAMDFTIPSGVTPRKYGETTDTLSTHGRLKRTPLLTISFFLSSGSETDLFAAWQGNIGQMVERRLRLKAVGSGNNNAYIDSRIRFRTVPVQEFNGASILAIDAECVGDSALGGSDLQLTLNNAIAS
ncbi:MAG TPA: hypothetical protein VK600_00435 [Candidatus Saccharimonadales bacterium]|nr:hypothetical protein [Candidatus Saccharimonadales bacterium]